MLFRSEEHDDDPELGSIPWNNRVAVRPVPADGEGRQPRERLVQRVADDELELCHRCGSELAQEEAVAAAIDEDEDDATGWRHWEESEIEGDARGGDERRQRSRRHGVRPARRHAAGGL